MQKKYLSSLLNIRTENPIIFKEKIAQILTQVQNSTLSIEEQFPLFATAAIGIKSFEYWQEKYVYWEQISSRKSLKYNLYFPADNFSIGGFCRADMLGAALAPKPPIIHPIVAIIGAATMNSAAYALDCTCDNKTKQEPKKDEQQKKEEKKQKQQKKDISFNNLKYSLLSVTIKFFTL